MLDQVRPYGAHELNPGLLISSLCLVSKRLVMGPMLGLCWGYLRLCWVTVGPFVAMLGAKLGPVLGDLQSSNTGPQTMELFTAFCS